MTPEQLLKLQAILMGAKPRRPIPPEPTPRERVLLKWVIGIGLILLIVWAAGQYTPAYPRQLPAQQQRSICTVDSDGVCR